MLIIFAANLDKYFAAEAFLGPLLKGALVRQSIELKHNRSIYNEILLNLPNHLLNVWSLLSRVEKEIDQFVSEIET